MATKANILKWVIFTYTVFKESDRGVIFFCSESLNSSFLADPSLFFTSQASYTYSNWYKKNEKYSFWLTTHSFVTSPVRKFLDSVRKRADPAGKRADPARKGKIRPEKGRLRSEKGQIRPEKGQIRPEKGRIRPEKGRIRLGNTPLYCSTVSFYCDDFRTRILIFIYCI